MSKVLYIIRNERGWYLKNANNATPVIIFKTQAEAIAIARQMAKETKAKILLQKNEVDFDLHGATSGKVVFTELGV